METLYLSTRDLATLLHKLDRARDGAASSCTIVKNDTTHPVYPQTLRRLSVMAIETEDTYLPGVSPRLHLSRATLLSLMAQLAQRSEGAVQIDDVEVCAVPDERYYVDRSAADFAPVGDLSSAFSRNRGKHNV